IVLNGLFPETIVPIQDAFKNLLPIENILTWHAPGPVFGSSWNDAKRRHNAELIREQFLASLKPDIVHITSLIEGYADNVVNSVGLSPTPILTAVTSYDFIPLIYKNIYLTPNPKFELLYREKLEHLNRAHLLLAISESSRLEAIQYLGVEPSDVINISAAADPKFKPIDVPRDIEQSLRQKYDLMHPFIMYSGASDPRKNLLGLIKAFANLHPEIRNSRQLAIVGKLPKIDRMLFEFCIKSYGLKPNHVVITDEVTDEEMILFYNLCELFVFPSWHEGFGLPVLEAMSCGAPVICSNTSSLPEVIGRQDVLFDPFNESTITKKIEDVLFNSALREELIEHGLTHSRKFSWEKSAQTTLMALEKCVIQNKHLLSNQTAFESEEWLKVASNKQKQILNKLTTRNLKLRIMMVLRVGLGLRLIQRLRLILTIIYKSKLK
ncbi:glycosyltransferase family 4 protein, partial [Acinetobacter bereziniae]